MVSIAALACACVVTAHGQCLDTALADAGDSADNPLVRLRVYPTTGVILDGVGWSRENLDSDFDFVSAECPDCGTGICPPVARTVIVTLEANTAIEAGFGISDLFDGNYTVTDVSYDTQGPLVAGEQVVITVTGDVIECSSPFSLWFSMCDVEPAGWHDACPPCPDAPLTRQVLRSFAGGAGDGSTAFGELTLDGTTLYGMTYSGGVDDEGVVFSMETDGTGFTTLHEFTGGTTDGSGPFGGLALDGTTLYGMTYYGGQTVASRGLVFSIETDGTGHQILYKFAGGTGDGKNPMGTPVVAGSTLYGSTHKGGTGDYGTVVSMATDGTNPQVLHHVFDSPTNSRWPSGSLTLDGNTLYGMTTGNGSTELGVIFSVSTDGNDVALVHDFTSSSGNMPSGSLLLDRGRLYGKTQYGGSSNMGILFSIATDGSDFQVLHHFAGAPSDGRFPDSGRLAMCDSTLYGTTKEGGAGAAAPGRGVVFSIATDGTGYQLLHEFAGGTGDGQYPRNQVIVSGSELYGMTYSGGANNLGVVYKLSP